MAGLRLNYDRFKRKHGVKLIDSVNCSWIVWHSVDMVWYCFVLFVSIRTEIQYVSCKTRVCPLIHCDLSFRKSSYITLNCRKTEHGAHHLPLSHCLFFSGDSILVWLRILSTLQDSGRVFSYWKFWVYFWFLRSINRVTASWWHERRGGRRCWRRRRWCCSDFC